MDGAQRPMTATLQVAIVMPFFFFLSFITCACMMKNYGVWFCLFLSVIKMTVCHEWRPGALLSPQRRVSHFHPWRCSRAFRCMALP